MCAINGITREDGTLVAEMNGVTRHRGPDGSRVWEGRGITLGHNRLAIIDLAERAAQPMATGDGRYTIVFNGEVYNYRELREELRGQYAFRTESDTEVLLAAYATWGAAVFPKLRGIFAFGIWDSERGELTLARDHFGVKPLYYSFENGVLTFSSELTGLTRAARAVSARAAALYLGFGYVPSPDALVEGVHKLPPGHVLRYRSGSISIERYFDPFTVKPGGPYSTSELRTVVERGVVRQLVSDRPIGIFLSGGLDSSIVLHHAARHVQGIRTFSVDFEMVPGNESEGEKFNSDAVLAAKTAKRYGASHTTFRLSIGDVRDSLIPALERMDEPVANPTAISQYLLAQWVRREGVVVALGGDGGDELFGGYTRHRVASAAHLFQHLPAAIRRRVAPLDRRLEKLNTPLPAPLHHALMVNKETIKSGIFTQDLHIGQVAEAFLGEAYARVPEGWHPVDAFMKVDRETWLPDESLARSDRSSMAHGLELRVPLLDFDTVVYADRIHPLRKTLPWRGKVVLRKAYRGHLPEYLFTQPKRGWISPGAKWFRDPHVLQTVRQVLSSGYYAGLDALVDWSKIQTLLDAHVEKRGYYLYPLWNVLALQVWAAKNRVHINK